MVNKANSTSYSSFLLILVLLILSLTARSGASEI